MGRTRLGLQHVTQVHLERMDKRHWKLLISDGVLFFPAKHVRSYVVTDKTLRKLQEQIDKELKD